MLDHDRLREVADTVRHALAAIDVTSLEEKFAGCAARRERIEETAAAARARLAEIAQETAEAERVGVARYDGQHAHLAFAELMGERSTAAPRRGAAELLRERDDLQLALRGEQRMLEGVEDQKRRLREEARAAIAEACAPLQGFVRDELPALATDLCTFFAVAIVAAQKGQARLDDNLAQAAAHLRRFVGGEAGVPAEVLGAFGEADAILRLANSALHPTIPVPRPDPAPVLRVQPARHIQAAPALGARVEVEADAGPIAK